MDTYDDIIHLEHPTSRKHPRMSRANRAAQFAPFAALAGYEASITETARTTDAFIALDDDQNAELDRRMAIIRTHLDELPELTIVYFVPDARKAGGKYRTIKSQVRKIDDYRRELVLSSGERIPWQHVVQLDGPWF
jgi:hypothetical protein